MLELLIAALTLSLFATLMLWHHDNRSNAAIILAHEATIRSLRKQPPSQAGTATNLKVALRSTHAAADNIEAVLSAWEDHTEDAQCPSSSPYLP